MILRNDRFDSLGSEMAHNVSRACEVAEKGAEYFLLNENKLSEKRHSLT